MSEAIDPDYITTLYTALQETIANLEQLTIQDLCRLDTEDIDFLEIMVVRVDDLV
jgi:hypothetical protein